MNQSRAVVVAAQIAVGAAFIAIWQTLVSLKILDPFFVSRPSEIAARIAQWSASGTLWAHLATTLEESLLGLLVGAALGVSLGFLLARSPFLARVLDPYIKMLNAVPRVVLAPLCIIWFGIDLGSKIALAFVLVAVLIFFTVYTGIRQVDRRLVERVKTLGGGRWTILREVYLPFVTAWIMGNLKVAVGFAFTGACVGEFVGASRGLGYLMSFAQSTYNAALMMAIVLLIMAFVLAIFAATGRLEKHLLRWR